MIFAPDTNTIIYYFKGLGRVAESFLSVAPAEIAIPSVVLYELEAGIAQSNQPTKRRAQLDELLDVITIMPFDAPSARSAAKLEASLRAAGLPIGPKDVLIAGTALAHEATLVTHNVREFRRVRGLHVVDWF
ncbi:MAG TPA: type II toxin-antitoxin system VapC family toxin [Bryobacteraceae bacterium]|jgi:tRNA(fMet)-specific endonuclease VapC